MKNTLGVIPARYHSERFPGKPLAPILGKPMIQWVYERALTAQRLSRIVIATDDDRILRAARTFGAEVLLTSPHHDSGTSRTAEAAASSEALVVVNIQGDEPLVRGTMIDGLIEALEDETASMSSLCIKEHDLSLLSDPNVVKVAADQQGFALYFSRSPLPFQPSAYFLRHVGIYGYRKPFLLKFAGLPRHGLEAAENLEQLRALENGFRIKLVETQHLTLSVDRPEDIIKVENLLKQGSHD